MRNIRFRSTAARSRSCEEWCCRWAGVRDLTKPGIGRPEGGGLAVSKVEPAKGRCFPGGVSNFDSGVVEEGECEEGEFGGGEDL